MFSVRFKSVIVLLSEGYQHDLVMLGEFLYSRELNYILYEYLIIRRFSLV